LEKIGEKSNRPENVMNWEWGMAFLLETDEWAIEKKVLI
jgi:hypothetical protein